MVKLSGTVTGLRLLNRVLAINQINIIGLVMILENIRDSVIDIIVFSKDSKENLTRSFEIFSPENSANFIYMPMISIFSIFPLLKKIFHIPSEEYKGRKN